MALDSSVVVTGARDATVPDLLAVTAPAPTVSGVSPARGFSAGGTAVTLTGTNFTGATSVTFGGVAATSVIVVGPTSITCNTPAGTIGTTVTVAVTTPGGTGSLASAFSYDWNPALVGTVRVDLNARNVTTAAGPVVTQMTDQSGNGYNATAPGGSEPSYQSTNASYSNAPTATFSGAQYLRTSGTSANVGSNPVTIIIVGHTTGGSVVPYSVNRDTELAVGIDSAAHRLVLAGSGYTSGVAVTNAATIVVGIVNGASSAMYVKSKTAVSIVGAATSVTAGQGWSIGNYQGAPGATFTHDGPIARVLIYDGALSNANVGAALDGLGAMYGITIAP